MIIKGILIDSEERRIKPVDVESDDIDQMHRLIKCECFTCVRFGSGRSEMVSEMVYVDDNGLLNDPKRFFSVPGYLGWLAGNGLILGVDRRGESVSTELTVEQVESVVRFFAID